MTERCIRCGGFLGGWLDGDRLCTNCGHVDYAGEPLALVDGRSRMPEQAPRKRARTPVYKERRKAMG